MIGSGYPDAIVRDIWASETAAEPAMQMTMAATAAGALPNERMHPPTTNLKHPIVFGS